MKKTSGIFLFLFLSLQLSRAQSTIDTLVLTLQEVVGIAKRQAPASKLASTLLQNRYWQYRTHKANYLPLVSLDAILPDLDRSISPVLQDDGTQLFVKRNSASSRLDLSVNQNIGLSGGSVFVGSTLNRIDLFGNTEQTSYSSNPVFVGFRQPILQFNSLKWNNRIEPLRYEESKRGYIEDMEEVSRTASDLFFDLLLAQVNEEIAKNNLDNNDTLYRISIGRYNLGKIAENDLLQMQMGVMNAKSNLAQGQLDMQLGMIRLRNYLNIKGEQPIRLIPAAEIPDIKVAYTQALAEAISNRQDMLSYQRQKLEAERDVAQAKGNAGFSADLFASYGLSQSAADISGTYQNPLEAEQLRLRLSIPIIDWGKGHSQVETAKANLQLTQLNLQVAEQNFEQEILLIVNRIQLLAEKVKISQQNDTVADLRNTITMKRYLIGKIDILDLNVARDARVQAKREYIQSLRDFWNAYYDLRLKTLYDFERNEKIKG